MNIKYIIVEDEKGALKNLQYALKLHTNFIELGYAHRAKKALALIEKQQPDVVFLDVELGAENGFDILKEVRNSTNKFPLFIMTTAHSHYARKAVNTDVFYFLDKPIDPDELGIALSKASRKIMNSRKEITIKNSEGHIFISLEKISYIKGQGNCCKIFRQDSTPILVTKTLKDIKNILPQNFLRIHKSYIINISDVKTMNTTKKIIGLQYGEELLELPIGNSFLEKSRKTLLR